MRETMKLRVSYYEDTDTLSLWNGEPASEADDVAENLIVDYDAEGDAVGFTLEHAAELLLPVLQAAAQSSDKASDQPKQSGEASAMPQWADT